MCSHERCSFAMSQSDVGCGRMFQSWRLAFRLVISYMVGVTIFVAATYSPTMCVRRDTNLIENSSLSSPASIRVVIANDPVNNSGEIKQNNQSIPGYVDKVNTIRLLTKTSINPLSPSCPANSTNADAQDIASKLNRDMSVESYLDTYTSYCCAVYRPKNPHLPPCPCVPDQLRKL